MKINNKQNECLGSNFSSCVDILVLMQHYLFCHPFILGEKNVTLTMVMPSTLYSRRRKNIAYVYPIIRYHVDANVSALFQTAIGNHQRFPRERDNKSGFSLPLSCYSSMVILYCTGINHSCLLFKIFQGWTWYMLIKPMKPVVS